MITHYWFVLCIFVCFSCRFTLCEDNGLALTPPMGFLDWERFRCEIDCNEDPQNCIGEVLFTTMADAMVKYGFRDAGYQYVNIDDCWSAPTRDAQGRLQADPKRFPHGIKWLADYMHTRGLKLGIYSAYSNYTCGGYLGSQNHVQTDADTFASWTIDSLKLDGCSPDTSIYSKGYPEFSKALISTGRPILYSCSWPAYVDFNTFNWTLIGEICNLWRLYDDVQDSWDSIIGIINYWAAKQNTLIPAAGPGHWNDPDMLIIGDFSLSVEESKVQFALWAIFAAPLYISADIRTMPSVFMDILLNREVIAVNQDPLGKQGRQVSNANGLQIWYRDLVDGAKAVALLNTRTDGVPYKITVEFSQIGITTGSVNVRDLFLKKDLGTFSRQFTAEVNPHGVVLVKLTTNQ
eukprot:TRINITY_DN1179_c0_g1_i1.p1 TRINITY_DN1179_c0_g1~~TRINITY_DN1179_c0_g1_i1.p1  ORF type:complete len:405 (+),score=55.48 TRINITY_DN1179_c0_g1_i1:37-1251(+)